MSFHHPAHLDIMKDVEMASAMTPEPPERSTSVVVDLGTSSTKAGWSDRAEPDLNFPSVIGRLVNNFTFHFAHDFFGQPRPRSLSEVKDVPPMILDLMKSGQKSSI